MTWRQRRSGLIIPDDRVWTPERKHTHLMAGMMAGTVAVGGGGGDPDFANVVLLMHMDASPFVDVIGHTVTEIGGAVALDTSEKYAGAGSVGFAANGRWLRVTTDASFAPGSGDFCFETYTRNTNVGATSNPALIGMNDSFNEPMLIYLPSPPATNMRAECLASDSTIIGGISGGALTASTWRHVAYVRNGTTFTLYVNGNSVGTATSSKALYSSGITRFEIGRSATLPYGTWSGQVDELRYTVGVPRYTANFTPPAVPFPDS